MITTPAILREGVLRTVIQSAENITTQVLRERHSTDAATADLAASTFTTVFAAVQASVAKWYASPESIVPEAQEPAYDVAQSVTSDFIYSLEDGKPYKSLRRHLNRIGLTPDQYRAKWNLPADYPMNAPEYSARRSAYAKNSGLGQRPPKTS